MNAKIVNIVAERITEELNAGIIPWQKPWTGTSAGAVSHTTGRPYSLINQMLLGKPGEYVTFKQAQAEGGKVRKGAKGKPVVFWKQTVIREKDAETGEETEKLIPVLRYYTVFHLDDCEGLTAKYPAEEIAHNDPIADAEKIVSDYQTATGIRIIRDKISSEAYYSPSSDYINVPNIDQFPEVEEFYSTLFHEMTHSTGHATRLNRFTGKAANAAFGSEEYSREELIAEIGAASLVNIAGIETGKSFKNSAAYVQSWARAIQADPQMILTAASRAEKAVEYIMSCHTDEPTPPELEERENPAPSEARNTYGKRLAPSESYIFSNYSSVAEYEAVAHSVGFATTRIPCAELSTGKITAFAVIAALENASPDAVMIWHLCTLDEKSEIAEGIINGNDANYLGALEKLGYAPLSGESEPPAEDQPTEQGTETVKVVNKLSGQTLAEAAAATPEAIETALLAAGWEYNDSIACITRKTEKIIVGADGTEYITYDCINVSYSDVAIEREMPYREYKANYANCLTKKGSYNADTKTVTVYVQ